jgi:hypothetical protein
MISRGFSLHGPPPAIIPGSATITIKARGMDGSIPVGSYCDVAPLVEMAQQEQQGGRTPVVVWPPSPLLVGSNGNWVAYNVTPVADGWTVRIEDANYDLTPEINTKHLRVMSNGNLSVSFALPLWSTATGRVLDAETGLPIEGAKVNGNYDRVRTDARGSFKLRISTNFMVSVGDSSKNYVTQMFHASGVAEGTNIVLPDARLNKGGWISGRAVPTKDSPTKQPRAEIRRADLRFVGLPSPWIAQAPDYVYADSNGVFQIGPLPPGTYRLEARYNLGKSEDPWEADGQVAGIKVEAGNEATNIVIETKTTTPSNGRRGP